MSRYRSIHITEPMEPFPSFFFPSKTLTLTHHDQLTFALDILNPNPNPSLFEVFDSVTDLIQLENRTIRRSRIASVGSEILIRNLDDRVSELELKADVLSRRFFPGERRSLRNLDERVAELELKADALSRSYGYGDRKYTWTAEVDSGDRKYKWTAEIKGGKKEKKEKDKVKEKKERKCEWTTEVKGKGVEGPTRRYAFTATTGGGRECEWKKEKKQNGFKRVVEIGEPSSHGSVVLRQAFAKRAENGKGKRKELSPQDAAAMIQLSFRAYLIRRSQSLRALRELAIAKAKLKEIRVQFNSSYRLRVARDAEERQRFSERIIVLLLTVDAIEGTDITVRGAKRSMVDELEAMLDVVDPQAPGKSLSMRRRRFDLPNGEIQKEIAAGVARVVQLIDQQDHASATFEACV